MMENKSDDDRKIQQKIKVLSSWSRLLGVLFRLIIIIGLLLLILFLGLFFLTPILPFWTLVFPLSVIAFGIVLARIEYALHKRLNRLKARGSKKDSVANGRNGSES
ncbi:MAG: hypothetical protein SVT56_04255 [Chloroflexota bacterium]|jgi:uncharacterized membrane protein (DUF485 family)|nr:hypothetical protein [Chloroflexota bacterium]